MWGHTDSTHIGVHLKLTPQSNVMIEVDWLESGQFSTRLQDGIKLPSGRQNFHMMAFEEKHILPSNLFPHEFSVSYCLKQRTPFSLMSIICRRWAFRRN